MSTVSGAISVQLNAYEVLNDLISSGTITHKIIEDLALKTGTSDGQINKAYAEVKSGIAASTTTVYNMIGTLTDGDGATIDFDEVVLIAIRNLSTDAVDHLEVGPDATNGFGVLSSNLGFWADASDRSIVMADSWTVWYSKAGVPAATGSTDELAVITPSGSAANTWKILIMGRDNP